MGDVVDLEHFRKNRGAEAEKLPDGNDLPCDVEPEWLTEFFASAFDPMTPKDGNEA